MAELLLTPAQHAALVALGEADVRRIVSATSPTLGLGRLVPRWHTPQPDPDPDPATADEWFTAHPDARDHAARALPALKTRLEFAVAGRNRTAIAAIVADMRTERAKPTSGEIGDASLKARFEAAGGDVTDPRDSSTTAETPISERGLTNNGPPVSASDGTIIGGP